PGPIKVGDEIVKYNLDEIKDNVPSTRSPIIINNMEKVEKIEVLSLGKIVKIGEPIMKVTLK
ncbi:MAG: PTS glucose transporter subunit IIA, partial [Fusobacterium nucleatum]|nr:PTS glucose transporter subunit IIA [Fusobacterium nucleatum]